jgi:hypothetical protein
MTRDEITVSLKMPAKLVEKIDFIANQKYLKRSDIIIDACAYYCQFHDMNSARFPETTRNILFNLARYDEEFRKTLREALKEDVASDTENSR